MNKSEDIDDLSIYLNQFNPSYTFDNFIVGNCNELAYADACTVSEQPGKIYNPFYIYGEVGLGKTHLIHAIGNKMLKNNSNAKILYMTSEQFIDRSTDLMKDTNYIDELCMKIDAFFIDNVEFLTGKEKVQDKFFHIFINLLQNRKQLVISSERAPKDLFLEDRLKVRFEHGLLTNILMSDYETRLNILKEKAKNNQILIDDDLLSVIAKEACSNVRALEGTLNRIDAFAFLKKSLITIEIVKEIIHKK